MNKEKILDRIKELEDEKAKCVATYSALEGAIQDSKFWLTKLEEKEETNEQDSSE